MKTFQEWSKLGYKINKGSKAHWINGVAMFDDTQVKKYDLPSYHNNWRGRHAEAHEDQHDELAECYGMYGSFWDNL